MPSVNERGEGKEEKNEQEPEDDIPLIEDDAETEQGEDERYETVFVISYNLLG